MLQAGDFNKTLADLISALGGNKSNPQCSEPGIDYKGQTYLNERLINKCFNFKNI